MFDPANIPIVLCHPSHPGNIGASARAMRTMGFKKLRLINPCAVDEVAYARASGADDVLDKATHYTSLVSALEDCDYVIATTARPRNITKPVLETRDLALHISKNAKRPALVFGNERTGLSNHELQFCHAYLTIQTADDYHSLNLACAVQIVCHAFKSSSIEPLTTQNHIDFNHLAGQQDVEQLFKHLDQVNHATGFYKDKNPSHAMQRMRALFMRARPYQDEVAMLHGVLHAMEKKVKHTLSETSDA